MPTMHSQHGRISQQTIYLCYVTMATGYFSQGSVMKLSLFGLWVGLPVVGYYSTCEVPFGIGF